MVITPDDAARERSEALSRTMVDLADTLVHDFDVVDFLQLLSSRCVEVLGLSSAGVMLRDQRENLQVMASSDERAHSLELMEVQNQEGPCLDAYRLSVPVQAGAATAAKRWPIFAERAQSYGYRTVGAVPLRLREQTIGALNMFSDSEIELHERDMRDAQALADIATIGLLNERAVREARLVAEQLQHALTSRVIIEQAKGVVAVRMNCGVDDAFQHMRTYARNKNLRLGEVARQVIEGDLPASAFTIL
jgi:transcriptional regulator with GAF, ATPase, and Fis domain